MSNSGIQPIRTTFVPSGMTSRQEIDAFAGQPINHRTPLVGRFFNEPTTSNVKKGYLLETGEILVIASSRLTGDMYLMIFANVQAQREYEEYHDRMMVADPETGRRAFLYQNR